LGNFSSAETVFARRHLQPPSRTAPTPASSISRRARSTRDTLPWAACTFHTPSNEVLHKTHCAKDRGRSKDTFGNRFEVYWYDAGDGVLHEDWHFKLMRRLIALYVIIGRRRQSLSENAVVPLMQLVTQWQGRRRAYLGCRPYASWPFPAAPSSKIAWEAREEAWGGFSLWT
jgi:hypothetical protein